MNEQEPRVATGVPGLDLVLGGGLLQGALAFLVGAAGTGKTVISQQIAFHAAAGGSQVLYFTTLSEPHTKLITHMRGFAFFDQPLIGDRLQLLNLEQVLRQGMEETADAVVQMAREQRASLVMIDGFQGVLSFINDQAHLREFLYQLSAQLAVLGTTALLTLEVEPHDRTLNSEMTTADVIIALYRRPRRSTHQRLLEIVKARGSNPLAGCHSLLISSAGALCYPQAELLPIKPAAGVPVGRAAFGLPELDSMLEGGLTAGSSTLLAGSLGAGKTLTSLTWLLEGAARGEPGLLMGFHESAQQLIDKAALLGLDLASPVAAGAIVLWTQPAVAIDPNRLAGELRERIEGGKTRRLVIDSEYELEHIVERDRVDEYLTALMAYLRGEGVTVLLAKEISGTVGAEPDFAGTPSALLAENVLLLQRQLTPVGARFSFRVLKMRFSAFDTAPHEYAVTNTGIVMGGSSNERRGQMSHDLSGDERSATVID